MEEDQKFVSLEEATERLGVARPTLYYYIRVLKLEKKKFPLDKRVYLAEEDVKRIETLKEQAQRRAEPSAA